MSDRYDRDSGIYRGVELPDRGEILSMIAHDMRSPLMAILGAVDMIADEQAGALDDHHRHLISVVAGAGRRLQALAAELSELGAVGSQRLVLERREQDVAALVRAAVEEVRLTADGGCHVEVTRRGSSLAVIDGDRVLRALINVLGNSVRHASERVCVEVDDVDDLVLITVKDDGAGIPAPLLDVVFEPFVTGGRGVGLGLAIAREVVRAHGGRVAASNLPGGGARFELWLPRAAPG